MAGTRATEVTRVARGGRYGAESAVVPEWRVRTVDTDLSGGKNP
jgi:hypothetical protein